MLIVGFVLAGYDLKAMLTNKFAMIIYVVLSFYLLIVVGFVAYDYIKKL